MRLDKYLKVTRLIKRRTIANEACDAGKVLVNDKIARASYDVKVGDIITINMGQKPVKVEVLNVTEYVKKKKQPRIIVLSAKKRGPLNAILLILSIMHLRSDHNLTDQYQRDRSHHNHHNHHSHHNLTQDHPLHLQAYCRPRHQELSLH